MVDTLHMKINAAVKDELKKLAERDNRTMANYIETVLKKHIEEKKNETNP